MSVLSRVQPVTRTSLAETAYESLLAAILSGRLAAGEEVTEVALAAELGISRTPVHYAIQRLVALGLIEQQAARPPRVARFGRSDVIELYGLRQLLEGEAAALAAERLAAEEWTAWSDEARALAERPTTASWHDRVIDFDVRFHDRLAAACGNRRLGEHVRQYRLLARAFCRQTGNEKNLRAALDEHRRVIAALLSGDAAEVRRSMHEHIARRLATVLAELFPTTSAAAAGEDV